MFKLGQNLIPANPENSARGILGESVPYTVSMGQFIPTSGNTNGTVQLSLVGLFAGQIVTNLICFVVVAGAALTFVKMGIYNKTGSLLGATAECSTSGGFNTTTGFKVIPLLAPIVIPNTDGYYVGFLQWGNLSTGATIMRGNSSTNSGSAIGSGSKTAMSIGAQSDLVTFTLPQSTSSSITYFAIS